MEVWNGIWKLTIRMLTMAMVVVVMVGVVAAADHPPLRVGSPVPAVSLPALTGPVVRLPGDLRGKVAIIHFWSAGCTVTCKDEMAALETLYSANRKRGLAVVAVTVGQRSDEIRAYLRGMSLTYPVLVDADRETAEKYDVVDLPRTFILDKSGLIRYKVIGATSEGALRKMVLSLL